MTPQRYQQINALADAALEMSADRRVSFLETACGGDSELRAEVEKLVAADLSQEAFMAAPVFEMLARDMAATNPARRDLSGRRVERYDVVGRLGAGGIGEVWLARDAQLDRDVALKLLSPDSAGDPRHVRRFQQEARAASTLNHPNIVTIYEIGKWEGVDFIAEERVAGKTIRQCLTGGPLAPAMLLNIGSQVAEALAAAHAAGIVHRDIKPENIMLRPDGLVKVLDFGLARFVEREVPADTGALNDSINRPGFVLGTVRYMSPEQARGLPVDPRSDVFSLGVVLYEMAAGAPPFSGETPTDILSAILTHEPPALSNYAAGTPPELERIVRRCLEKDRQARYPSARELCDDLARLAASPPPSSGTSLIRRRRSPMIATVAAAIVLGAVGYWFFTRADAGASFNRMRITRITTRGEAVDSTISRDGRYLAYVLSEPRGQSIWTTQLETSSEVASVRTEPGTHWGLTFSPDGTYVYYRRSTSPSGGELYRAPALGGTAVKLIENISGAPAISPDGKRLAFVRLDSSRWEASLIVANADGSGEKVVAARRRPRYLDQHSIAWSPDGHWIACFAGQATSYASATFQLVAIRVADGAQATISSHAWSWPESVTWSADGGTLVVSAASQGDDVFQLWTVTRKDGRLSRLTNDLSNYDRTSLTADGRTLVTTQVDSAADIWVAPQKDIVASAKLTSASLHFWCVSASWAPQDRILYSEPTGDYRNVWIMDADGSNRKQLTSGAGNRDQAVATPDGRYIVYGENGNVWRMDPDGRNPRQLTRGPLDVHPAVTPDSRSVVYASFSDWSPGIGGEPSLWQMPIEGGQPVQISKQTASFPAVSPDGKRIACIHFPGRDPRFSANRIVVMDADGGGNFKVYPASPALETPIVWSPDGKALDYIINTSDGGNIWRQPIGGGPATQVTKFNGSELFALAWSLDGRQLAYARGKTSRAVVRIDDFR